MHESTEKLDEKQVSFWLINTVKSTELNSRPEKAADVCKLNDFSSLERSQIMQASQGEDRI